METVRSAPAFPGPRWGPWVERTITTGQRLAPPLVTPVLAIAAVLVFAGSIFLLVRTPVLFETLFPADTSYILNVAWTVHEGFRPNVDFTERYGGLVSRLIALCISWEGEPSVKALDHAFALTYVLLTVMLAVAGARRLSAPLLFGAFLILTALVTAKTPLEFTYTYTTYVSHATFYNRVAWSLLLIAFVPAMLPSTGARDLPGAVVGGVAAVAMVLTKLSFVVALLPIAAAFVLTGRPRALLVWLGAMAGTFVLLWLLLATGPAQWLRIVHAFAEIGGVSGSRFASFGKAFGVVLRGLFPLLAVLALCATYLAAVRERAAAPVALALLFLAVGIAIAVTTGTFGMKTCDTPAFAIAAVVLAEWMRRDGVTMARTVLPVMIAVGSFAVPYLLNAAAASAQESRIGELRLINRGPLRDYAVAAGGQRTLAGGMTPANLASVRARIASDGDLNNLTAQQMLMVQMEAVPALESLPEHRTLGILSQGPRFYPFALGARPITSVDSWVGEGEIRRIIAGRPPADIGLLVTIRGDIASTYLDDLARVHFVPCRRTLFSDIHISRALLGSATARGCDPALRGETRG